MPKCRRCAREGNSIARNNNNLDSDDGFIVGDAMPHYAPDQALEPVHLQVQLTVLDQTLADKTFYFKVTHSIQCNNEATAPRCVELNGIGFTNLTVVSEDHEKFPIDWRYDGEVITVIWRMSFAQKEVRTITVSYSVENPVAGLLVSCPDESNPNVARYVVTDSETERARYWLACIDAPAVRVALDWTIRVPVETWEVMTNGKEVNKSKDESLGLYVSTWTMPFRTPPYLICFALGEFVRFEDDSFDGCPVAYFAPKDKSGVYDDIIIANHLKTTFGRTGRMLQWLEDRLGVPFPFKSLKYYQVVGYTLPSAMENTTLTTWSGRFFCDDIWGKEFAHYTDQISVHEMAHSYFGDSVVIRHFDQAWLKESFADYMESCWLENNASKEDHEYNLFHCGKLYMDECDGKYARPMVTRTYNSSFCMYDDHLYPGGARRLHMLRHLLGDKVFWPAITEYLTRYAGKVVDTEDFRKVLEERSSLNLQWWFDQWIYGKGYPKLKGDFKWNPNTSEVAISLRQTQVDKAGGVPLFFLDVPIHVIDSKGITHMGKASFRHNQTASVSFSLGYALPTTLLVDPEYTLLFGLDLAGVGQDILSNTMTSPAAKIPHKIWALQSLVKMGTYASHKAVASFVIDANAHHGLQTAAADIAVKTRTLYSTDLITKLIDSSENPLAQAGILLACRTFKDPRVRESLLSLLARDAASLLYRVRARAMEVLAYQSNPDDFEVLRCHADAAIGSWQGIFRSGALTAMGQHGSDLAYRYLAQFVDNGTEPSQSRPAAVSALGNSVYWIESAKKWVVSKLEALLRDPEYNVRYAAIGALGALKSKDSVSAIEAVAASAIANQDQPYVQRNILKIKTSREDASQHEKQARFAEEIELLKSEIATLSAKFDMMTS